MSTNSCNFKGLQNGKSLEAQSFPSQSVNNQNPKRERERERDLADVRHRWRYLQVFLGILFMSNALNSFSQTTAPKVHWRRFDWAQKNPDIPNSSASGQTFTRKESGSDWWYDVKNSFEPGATEDYPMPSMVHNGYILSGYSNIRNYIEAENGNGCNLAQQIQNLDCSYFETGSDPTTPNWFHTVAKLKPDGLTMEWFHFLPFSGNGYRVTQLMDGSYIVVGDSKSTRTFDGAEIYYNPELDGGGMPIYNSFCGTNSALAVGSNGSIGAKMMGLALDPYAHFGFDYAMALNKDYLLLQRLGNNTEAIIQLHDYLAYYSSIISTTSKLDLLDANGEASLDNIASVTTIDGIYASVALAATNKGKYGYNPKPIRIVNGYRESPPEIAEPNVSLSVANTQFNFTIQPNPANDIVQLIFNNELPILIEISDLTGKVILNKVVQNSNNISINLFDFATGFYLVKAVNGVNESKIEKLIIVK